VAEEFYVKRVDGFSPSKFYLVNKISKYQHYTDSDLADMREKLYHPSNLIGGHMSCDDESAVAEFHNEISRNLTELCCEDDARSREAGLNTLIKLAVYSKPP